MILRLAKGVGSVLVDLAAVIIAMVVMPILIAAMAVGGAILFAGAYLYLNGRPEAPSVITISCVLLICALAVAWAANAVYDLLHNA